MTEEKAETSNAQKLVEIIRMDKELSKESQRHHALEERLDLRHKELRERLEKIKKENERIETTLGNI